MRIIQSSLAILLMISMLVGCDGSTGEVSKQTVPKEDKAIPVKEQVKEDKAIPVEEQVTALKEEIEAATEELVNAVNTAQDFTSKTGSDLELAGWEKSVDEFAGTTQYTKQSESAVYCGTSNVTGAVGIVNEIQGELQRLNYSLMFFGQKEPIRPTTFNWKTDSGNQSRELVCEQPSFQKSSWTETCYFMEISEKDASSLSKTDFIRVGASGTNLDLKKDSDDKCTKFFNGLIMIAKDYASE